MFEWKCKVHVYHYHYFDLCFLNFLIVGKISTAMFLFSIFHYNADWIGFLSVDCTSIPEIKDDISVWKQSFFPKLMSQLINFNFFLSKNSLITLFNFSCFHFGKGNLWSYLITEDSHQLRLKQNITPHNPNKWWEKWLFQAIFFGFLPFSLSSIK